MTCVLAIDQGTSGTKAIVVDEAGVVLVAGRGRAPSPATSTAVGSSRTPRRSTTPCVSAGRRAVAEAGVPIAAVALANQGETVLAWDRATGRPLSAAVVWQDRRAEVVCDARTASAGRVAELTGLVLDPYFSAPKMRWLRDHVTTEGVVTTTDTWLVHRLCGAFVTDCLDRQPVADPRRRRGRLVRRAARRCSGWTTRRCPRSSPATTSSARPSMFGGSVPVTGLIVDQQAALLAEACLDAGTAKCTFGTGAFLLAQLGDRAVRSTAGLTTSVAWRLRWPHVVLRGRAGLHRRLGGAVGHRARPGRLGRPARRRRRRRPATACCACRRWPGSPRPGGTRRRRPRSRG